MKSQQSQLSQVHLGRETATFTLENTVTLTTLTLDTNQTADINQSITGALNTGGAVLRATDGVPGSGEMTTYTVRDYDNSEFLVFNSHVTASFGESDLNEVLGYDSKCY